jgi:hypothetical protein
MNHFLASAAFLTISALLTALISLGKGPRSSIARLFACHWIAVSVWSLSVAAQFRIRPLLSDFWWGWILHVGATFIPVFFLHFAVAYASGLVRAKIPLIPVGYFVTVAYNVLNLFPGLFTGPVVEWPEYGYPKPGTLYPVFFLTFVVMIVSATMILVNCRRQLSPERASVLNRFLSAHVLGYLGGIDNFAIMVDVRLFPLYPYGLYLAVFYAVVSSWLVKKRNLLSQ